MWLVFGIALLLLLVVEVVYRAQASIRLSFRPAPKALHPYADSAWFEGYESELQASTRMTWDPYVYVRRLPFAGTYINVDASGHRRTINPPGIDSPLVLFLGGSTMWGTGQRDAWTIPSLVAARATSSGHAFRAVNMGEAGYEQTREVLRLALELRSGLRPDVVVFYDGINDVAAALQNGQAGIPQNEQNRRSDFELGRAVNSWQRDVAAEMRAGVALLQGGARRLRIIDRLSLALNKGMRPPEADAGRLAADVADTYARTAELVGALGARYGFQAIFAWQPTPFTTRKRLTEYETLTLAGNQGGFELLTLQAVHRAVPGLLQAAWREHPCTGFVELTGLFDGDSAAVFLDWVGHTTEWAHVAIADTLGALIRHALARGCEAPA